MVEGFEDGVWWVELAPDRRPRRSCLERWHWHWTCARCRIVPLPIMLVEPLEPKKTLLILDNCEHLVEACADLADTLLRACPNLKLLATSREPLRIAGESSFMVPSLSLPEPGRKSTAEELAGYEAVHLFVERAKAVDSGFALTEGNAPAVARLCAKLDGIPLALELAAARTRVLTVEQISEKLQDPLGLLTTGSRTAAAAPPDAPGDPPVELRVARRAGAGVARAAFGVRGGLGLWRRPKRSGAGGSGGLGTAYLTCSRCSWTNRSLWRRGGWRGRFCATGCWSPLGSSRAKSSKRAMRRPRSGGATPSTTWPSPREPSPSLLGPDQGLWLGRLRTEFGNLRGALSWSLEPDDDSRRARAGCGSGSRPRYGASGALQAFRGRQTVAMDGSRERPRRVPRRQGQGAQWARLDPALPAGLRAGDRRPSKRP